MRLGRLRRNKITMQSKIGNYRMRYVGSLVNPLFKMQDGASYRLTPISIWEIMDTVRGTIVEKIIGKSTLSKLQEYVLYILF